MFRQHTGPLTRELLLEPAAFGLGKVPAKAVPDATTDVVCGYCSTGCSLRIHLKDGEAVNLTPATEYPVNLGMACPKGWEALSVLDSPDRATTPLLRDASGRLQPVDWDTAMREFVWRFKDIQMKHGPESVAFLSTGQIPTEEMALLGALAKFGMGIRHGDGNTRQCMATSVVAYKQAFGFDAPPYTYQDFEESDVIVLIGGNLCIAHPIMWERVMRNPHNPRIVVVDPRTTETAMSAALHLPLAPKSDQTLLYGVAKLLIESDWIDRDYIAAHTNGFAEFAAFVNDFPLERVCAETGLAAADVRRFAELIHDGQRVSFWWTMGVNQSYQGVRTAQAIINLALMTGNMGRPGTGANSITGQCNAMGSRLFSNTTNLLGGHDFANDEHRSKVAGILGIDAKRIPTEASWAYDQIIEGILRDRIKGLWVICTNTAHSWINQTQCRDILDRLDFLVVQDMYHTTETAQMANLVLPAAGWGEKEGTFINSERRIGVIKKIARAPGQALSDFNIFKLVAHYWGCEEMFAAWNSPDAVFQILKALSEGQPCDITGIAGYEMIDAAGGIQWPFVEGPGSEGGPGSRVEGPATEIADRDLGGRGSRRAAGGVAESRESRVESREPEVEDRGSRIETMDKGQRTKDIHSASQLSTLNSQRRLFTDGRYYHADGKARFCFEEPKPLSEPPTPRYPFILLTGRGSASQWHTQTRTAKSSVLRKLYPESLYVEINPTDARRLGVSPGETVTVESQRGALEAKAFLTNAVRPGQVFLPMHYETANRLTDAVFDPYSRQPSYKACAVNIARPMGM